MVQELCTFSLPADASMDRRTDGRTHTLVIVHAYKSCNLNLAENIVGKGLEIFEYIKCRQSCLISCAQNQVTELRFQH